MKTCPKCKTPCADKVKYCVCGHKFIDVMTDQDVMDFFNLFGQNKFPENGQFPK